MKFVVGFAIDTMLEEVLLIRKLKPQWQKGHLNGVGGKCAGSEWAYDAMRREFHEETGIFIDNWRRFCTTQARDGEVHFFVTLFNKFEVEQKEDEEPVWVSYRPLPIKVVDNLQWMIPMAIAEIPVIAEVTETELITDF